MLGGYKDLFNRNGFYQIVLPGILIGGIVGVSFLPELCSMQNSKIDQSPTGLVLNQSNKSAVEVQESLNIGLTTQDVQEVVKILRILHADEFALYTKTLNFHWNVYGPHFNDLHLFFKSQYEALFKIVDDLAERTRALGANALGTIQEFGQYSRISEVPGEVLPAQGMLKTLLNDHEMMVRNLRTESALILEKFQDSGTNNFLIDIMNRHEKMAWMLRAAVRE